MCAPEPAFRPFFTCASLILQIVQPWICIRFSICFTCLQIYYLVTLTRLVFYLVHICRVYTIHYHPRMYLIIKREVDRFVLPFLIYYFPVASLPFSGSFLPRLPFYFCVSFIFLVISTDTTKKEKYCKKSNMK